jgi:hypothetical protein
MQCTLEQVDRLTADEFDAVPMAIPGKMLTVAYIQARELCEENAHPGNDVEMVTTNQALLKIRNQVVPNNMAKHLRKAINADVLEKNLRQTRFELITRFRTWRRHTEGPGKATATGGRSAE